MVESLLWTSHHKGLTAEKGREFKRFVAGGGSGRHWAAAAKERTAADLNLIPAGDLGRTQSTSLVTGASLTKRQSGLIDNMIMNGKLYLHYYYAVMKRRKKYII